MTMSYSRSGLCVSGAWQRWMPAFFALLLGLAISPICVADANEDFFKATKMDNKVELQSLLRRGISPNLIEPERGETALMLAVREGSMEALSVLLNARGIKFDLRAKNGDTALMIAAFKKNRPAVESLLAKGAQVNNDGWTALHYAAAGGETEIVELLIKRSAEVDAVSPNLTTPLMMAAGEGHIHVVKMLLDAGADLSRANEQGFTAIDFAQKKERVEIVEGLKYRQMRAAKRAAEALEAEIKQQRPPITETLLPPID